MKRVSLLMVALFATIFVMQSCKDDSKVKENAREQLASAKDKVNNATRNPKDVLKKQEAEPVGPTTTVKFEEMTYDFGKVMEGEIVEHDYKFKNTGTEPLVLKKVKASCGCTVPTWPRNAIAPGESALIHAKFDTKRRGRPGGAPQNKSITVTGNIEGGKVVLKLKGLVDKKVDPNAKKAANNGKVNAKKVNTIKVK